MGKTVIMFPGQGAQKIGMSQEFYEKYKVSRDCFEKAELKGYVFGSGIAEPGDAKNHAETLLDAYNLGKSL
mgnify:CR=1 FL=1